MKKSYSIFLSILFCFLFCSLSAQDAQLNAASRKVIIEAPAEPGTHLEVAYRPAGSFFPSYVQTGKKSKNRDRDIRMLYPKAKGIL